MGPFEQDVVEVEPSVEEGFGAVDSSTSRVGSACILRLMVLHGRVVFLVVGMRRARQHTPRTTSPRDGGHVE